MSFDLEIFQYGFMQRAILSGILVAILCSTIGFFLVQRKQSLFGDALSHMAFGGIAIGLYANIYPLWTGLAISISTALAITKIRQITKFSADATIAVLLSFGLAIGVVLISLSGGFSIDIFSFLFGNILLVNNEETIMTLIATIGILFVIFLFFKKFMYITFDEDQAKSSGINVERFDYLFTVLAAITVIAAMRLAGILLISSLIVIPNLTALMFGKGFKKTLFLSIILSIFSVVFGIILSYFLNLSPSGVIVMISVIIFVIVLSKKYLLKIEKKQIMT